MTETDSWRPSKVKCTIVCGGGAQGGGVGGGEGEEAVKSLSKRLIRFTGNFSARLRRGDCAPAPLRRYISVLITHNGRMISCQSQCVTSRNFHSGILFSKICIIEIFTSQKSICHKVVHLLN